MYKEMYDLTGRVAIVTGGSRGIGEAIAMALAEAGARVVLSSRKIEGLNAVKEKIEAAGGEAMCIPAHMGKTESLQGIVDGTLEAYGTIDILVNNAATNPIFGPMMETADEGAWDKIMDVNVKGVFFLTKAVAKVMLEKGKGTIINVSSEAAVKPTPFLGIYSISKAAIDMVTKTFALELGGQGIRVNGIAPGLVKTHFSQALWSNDMIKQVAESKIPRGSMGMPEEMGSIALFLASDASAFINGQTIIADGGAILS